ncbi:MAG TPA: hypothetical protein VHE09_07385 [Rhizomicrobium sp.]|nr:hypothetical protein [Rhizomicrobium sp.]
MDDLALEIMMGAVLLGIVLRLRWKGNPRPAWFVAALGATISAMGIIRRIELSDILIPMAVAAASAAIGLAAHRVRPKTDLDSQ